MHILTKGMLFVPMITAVCIAQVSYAKKEDSLELNKSCIKLYPLADGDTDADLISLYTQMCDKNNRKNQALLSGLQIQIAQKYQAQGYNLKALQAVAQLRNQNISTPEMTEAEFLAGTAISQNALNHMRTVELHSLSEEAYQPAKVLADTIRFAQPVVQNRATVSENAYNKKKSNKKTPPKTAAVKKTKAETPKSAAAKASKTNRTTAPAVKESAEKTSNSSPFETFNKK
ncbi:hypothetical protein EXE25_09425 [Acinetobacter bouvetii]|uniref:Uncharacterized protein n=1 Tax=Acinetobacter bouvetii TaxID=202951 RepID=A0A4Q7AWJ5_9GAMM|nr:hypothetical protein [Acinetobacter bouvetii]RZG66889.1 hypothetical protein EXE25_09425 [Acinetobacter bouvetii]